MHASSIVQNSTRTEYPYQEEMRIDHNSHGKLWVFCLVAFCFALLVSSNVSALEQSATRTPVKKYSSYVTQTNTASNTYKNDYTKLCAEKDRLKKNQTKALWRQPWETLQKKFFDLSKKSTDKSIAASAFFQAAQCQYEIAKATHVGEDYRAAVKIYVAVASEFAKQHVADEALYSAVSILFTNLREYTQAQKIAIQLINQYPKSNYSAKAKEIVAQIKKSPQIKQAAIPELENIRWTTKNKNSLDIIFEFSNPAKLTAKLVPSTTGGSTNRIDINIFNASVVSEIRRGVAIKNNFLKSISVTTFAKGNTHIYLDVQDIKSFSTKLDKNSQRIVLSCSTKKEGKATASRSLAENTPQAGVLPAASIASLNRDTFSAIRTITIDAGHGGKDPGTSHNGICEREITLDVAKRLGKLLQDNGFRVIYTRRSNSFVSLGGRAQLANENHSDLFVSVHVNANDAPFICGFETYYYGAPASSSLQLANRENGTRSSALNRVRPVALNARALQSKRLAADIQANSVRRVLGNGFRISSNGVKAAPFFVLNATSMPAILAEIGYCTNAADAAVLARPAYRQAIAEGIAEGILAYRNRVISRMTAARRAPKSSRKGG